MVASVASNARAEVVRVLSLYVTASVNVPPAVPVSSEIVCTSLTVVLLPEIVAAEMLAPFVRLLPLAVMLSTPIVPDVTRKRGAVSAFDEVLSYFTLMFPEPMPDSLSNSI